MAGCGQLQTLEQLGQTNPGLNHSAGQRGTELFEALLKLQGFSFKDSADDGGNLLFRAVTQKQQSSTAHVLSN